MSMSPQKDEPDPGAVERQHGRQRRWSRGTKIGALAVAAGIAGLALLAIRASAGDDGQQGGTSTGTGPSVTVPGVPKVDYMIDLNTGVMTPLPKAIVRSLGKSVERGLSAPRYAASPDGSLLAYVGTGDRGSPQIFIAGINGTGVRQMTLDPRRATSPAWSPDGTKIAYVGSGSGDVRKLYVLDVATRKSTPIAHGPPVPSWDQPQFTPDGSSLVYSRHAKLWTVPVAGGKSTILIGPGEGVTDAGNGSLSPDGSLVTFLGSGTPRSGKPVHCGPCRWVAKADGTERRVIPGWISNPAGTWSPDGRRIVCLGVGGSNRIIVVDIATRDASRVAKGRGAIWLNRHTLLVEV